MAGHNAVGTPSGARRCSADGKIALGLQSQTSPELPDDTSVENVRFATRIRNALNVGGMKTIGEVREASDAALLSLPDFGSSSLSYLREALGLPSTDGVRPKSKKPT